MDDDHATARKTDAQARADDIRAFNRELARLDGEGIDVIDAAQRERLRGHHAQVLARLAQSFDIDRDPRAAQLSLGMRVASFLGALALATSVFFLFYRVWGLVPTPVQVAVLVAAPLLTLALTLYVRARDTTGYFAKLAALVAFACLVLNTVMIGEGFNLTPTEHVLLPWAAFAFLLAWACDLRLLLVAGILCALAWTTARIGSLGGLFWADAGQRPENLFLPALALFLLPLRLDLSRHAGFAATFRLSGLFALFLPLTWLSHVGGNSYLPLDSDTVEHLYRAAGFLLAAGAAALGIRRQWPETTNAGIAFFVLFLFTQFFDWWWDLLPKYLFFLLLALVAILVLLVLRRLRDYARRAGA